jgi:hypothetical protein
MFRRSRNLERAPNEIATTVAGTEEGRAFLQARLATFGKSIFLLAGAAWTALALLHLFGFRNEGYTPFSLNGGALLAGSLLCGLLWVTTRSGRRSPAELDALDIGISILVITAFTTGGAAVADSTVAISVALLSFNTVMLTRAIVVPSTPRRTFLIGLVTVAEVVAFAAWRTKPGMSPVVGFVTAACWSSVGIAIGTLASRTIFGLRREVDQARVLGQYRLEERIGHGGMGEVWRASHSLLRRPTAVKLLPPDRMGEDTVRRFEREVQITALLTHPNTVAIYDYGRTRDGIFYYAMELLEGIDLESLVTEHGPQPPARVAHVLVQICGALAEAHDLGLVHRDVKPANILVSPRKGEHEFAKILDFGLVKSIETGGDHPGVTAANTIAGTPLFMSPEAIRAPTAVDARSDLYSLGAVAWYLLVGRPPFQGQSILDVCSHHLYTPASRPSTALGRRVPAAIEDAVLACLDKRPEARPQGARELRARLESSAAAEMWTVDEAAAWWRERPAGRLPGAAAGGRTIALDLGLRATHAPGSQLAPQ